jgi:hypothetical protein
VTDIAAPGRPAHTEGQRLATVLKLLLLVLPAIWMAGYLFPPINHDAASILDVCKRWLNGETLYRDIIDVQAPLVFVLYAVPELLSRVSGIPAPTALTLCLIAAIASSFQLVRRSLALVDVAQQPLTGALLPAMSLFLMAVFPLSTFGQREHFMLVVSLPYIFISSARADKVSVPLSLALPVAFLAGMGLGLKPHFLGIPVLVELYVLFRAGFGRAVRDVVPWIMLAVFIGHVAFAALVTPHYFTLVLPLIFSAYVKMGGSSVDALLGAGVLPTAVALVLLTGAAFFWLGSLARINALFAIGAILSPVLQAKGWDYHMLPANAATVLLGAGLVTKTLDRYLPFEPQRHRLPVAIATTAFMLLFYHEAALLDLPFKKQLEFRESPTGRLLSLVKGAAPNRTILVLSPGIYPHYPLINYLGARMTTRFQTMWPIQGFYADCPEMAPLYNPPDAMSEGERYVFQAVPEDFAREKPDLLIVDRVAGIPRCRADTFNYLDYFSRNPLFAKTFESYEPYANIDRYEIFRRVTLKAQ